MKHLPLALAIGAVCLLVGCAESPKPVATAAVVHSHRVKVRTTAYTRTEDGGVRNALGVRLSSQHLRSAAADWSRFPLGTRFRIVGTKEEYIIDDYGTALVGTNTIDLYKPTRLEMKRWGVRHVDIDVVEWGSREQSLKVLAPRAKHRIVQQMMVSLQKQPLPSRAPNSAN